MPAFYLLSIWLHVVAAGIWIGGMIFLALVLVPAIRQSEYQGVSSSLIHITGIRFRWVGWICLVLFPLTGVVNLVYRGVGWEEFWSRSLWQSPFGRTLAFKLALFAAILLFSVVHDFFIGPKAADLLESKPSSLDATRLRREASWIGRFNLLLALAVVALGVMLARETPL